MKESIKHILRALKLIFNSSRSCAYVNMAFIILRGAVPIMMLWVIKLLIDTTVTQIESKSFDINIVIFVLGAVGVLFIVNSVTASLHQLVKERQSYKLNQYVSNLIHEKTTQISYLYYEDANYQNIFFRAISEAQSKPQLVFYNIISVLQNCLTLCIFATILLSIHWLMPFVILIVALPVVFLRIYFSRKYFELRRQQTDDERRIYYYNRILTAKEFAKEVRIFNLSKIFRSKYSDTDTNLHISRRKLLRQNVIQEALLQFVLSLIMIGVFGFVIWQATKGNMSVGMLAMYFMTIHRSYGLTQDLLQRIANLYETNLFLKNFFEFLDMPIGTHEATNHFPSKLTNGISVRNVSFKYPNTNRIVLNDVSFDIQRGETVAIVGNNGSGKSTLIKMLCGLYEPTSGSIEYDGLPLSEMPRDEIAKNISAIFQDFMLYNASARENIWFGDINAEPNDINIRNAALSAGLDELFQNLKNGYETQLGNLFPDGEMLSQGEWQRTALARSFFNEAQVIIMDEPTSSLDAFTEADLIENFRAITQGRTSIIVSHRLSTIRLADRIIVLDNKKIAEVGTFDELIQQNGILAKMVDKLNT